MEARLVSQQEIAEKVSGWKYIGNSIEKKFQFKNFKTAFEFMTKVALVCEEMNHHPKWTNNYNQLLICLETHDQSAVTELDIDLAQKIDQLFEENKA
jgi:4a-hydroxytetrahydrobiopterin dehydratase